MRYQRRAPVTVTLVAVSSTGDDGLGNFTEDPTETEVTGAIFEPERQDERAGNDQATVLQPAAWNVPGVHELNSNDQVLDGDDVWYVIGGSTVWLDRTNIPVSRTRAE